MKFHRCGRQLKLRQVSVWASICNLTVNSSILVYPTVSPRIYKKCFKIKLPQIQFAYLQYSKIKLHFTVIYTEMYTKQSEYDLKNNRQALGLLQQPTWPSEKANFSKKF